MCFVVWFSHRDDEGVASAEEVLQGLSLNPSMEDCVATRRVCQIVSTRAAHLCAAALVAVLRQIRDNKAAEKLRATIGVDGSVYKNHQEYVFFWALTVLFCVTTVQGHSWWLTWPGKLLLQSRTHWILFFSSFRKNFSSLAEENSIVLVRANRRKMWPIRECRLKDFLSSADGITEPKQLQQKHSVHVWSSLTSTANQSSHRKQTGAFLLGRSAKSPHNACC